jgi:hypothetical protein
MKYIKLYENLEDPIPKELCKYLVWRDGEYKCNILENTYKVEWSGNPGQEPYKVIPVLHLYSYNFKNENLEKLEPNSSNRTTGLIYDMIDESMKKSLLYQSNDLQDCIDTVQAMSTSKKYNL